MSGSKPINLYSYWMLKPCSDLELADTSSWVQKSCARGHITGWNVYLRLLRTLNASSTTFFASCVGFIEFALTAL